MALVETGADEQDPALWPQTVTHRNPKSDGLGGTWLPACGSQFLDCSLTAFTLGGLLEVVELHRVKAHMALTFTARHNVATMGASVSPQLRSVVSLAVYCLPVAVSGFGECPLESVNGRAGRSRGTLHFAHHFFNT